MNKKKILFTSQFKYEGVIYEKGNVYEITTERNIAQRFLNRGCVEVFDGIHEDSSEANNEASDKKTIEVNSSEIIKDIIRKILTVKEEVTVNDVEKVLEEAETKINKKNESDKKTKNKKK